MLCNHDFTELARNFDFTEDGQSIQGKRMVCVFCGQVRDVFSTGEVIIRKKEGTVTSGNKYENRQ